jgi:hypothetical protein
MMDNMDWTLLDEGLNEIDVVDIVPGQEYTVVCNSLGDEPSDPSVIQPELFTAIEGSAKADEDDVERLKEYRKYLETGEYPERLTHKQKRNFRRYCKSFVLNESREFCKIVAITVAKGAVERNLIVPVILDDNVALEVIRLAHYQVSDENVGLTSIGSHARLEKTMDRLRKVAFIPNVTEKVKAVLHRCVHCMSTMRRPDPYPGLHPIITERPLQKVFIDLTMWPKDKMTGASYAIMAIDHFTKFVWAQELTSKATTGVVQFLEQTFTNLGRWPEEIVSDNGGEFTSKEIEAFAARHGIRLLHGLPCKPTTQGVVERVQQTIAKYIMRSVHDKENWVAALQPAVYAYNMDKHGTTQAVPWVALHEKFPVQQWGPPTGDGQLTPQEISTMHASIKQQTTKAAMKMASRSMANAGIEHREELNVGTRVFVKTPATRKNVKSSLVYAARIVHKANEAENYRLQWITPGLDGEKPNEMSTKCWHRSVFVPIQKDTTDALLMENFYKKVPEPNVIQGRGAVKVETANEQSAFVTANGRKNETPSVHVTVPSRTAFFGQEELDIERACALTGNAFDTQVFVKVKNMSFIESFQKGSISISRIPEGVDVGGLPIVTDRTSAMNLATACDRYGIVEGYATYAAVHVPSLQSAPETLLSFPNARLSCHLDVFLEVITALASCSPTITAKLEAMGKRQAQWKQLWQTVSARQNSLQRACKERFVLWEALSNSTDSATYQVGKLGHPSQHLMRLIRLLGDHAADHLDGLLLRYENVRLCTLCLQETTNRGIVAELEVNSWSESSAQQQHDLIDGKLLKAASYEKCKVVTAQVHCNNCRQKSCVLETTYSVPDVLLVLVQAVQEVPTLTSVGVREHDEYGDENYRLIGVMMGTTGHYTCCVVPYGGQGQWYSYDDLETTTGDGEQYGKLTKLKNGMLEPSFILSHPNVVQMTLVYVKASRLRK